MIDDALTARIELEKSRLLAGGLLREVEWGVPEGERDIRGRITYAYSTVDAMIERRPALDRGTASTERSDDITLTILDPLAITDAHLFRWGDPPHIYSVKSVDGIVQNTELGTRYFSAVTVIR